MTKKEKMAVFVTVVWSLIFFPIIREAPGDGDLYLVTGIWLAPVVLWWGWHLVNRA